MIQLTTAMAGEEAPVEAESRELGTDEGERVADVVRHTVRIARCVAGWRCARLGVLR